MTEKDLKARYFGLYIGQKVFSSDSSNGEVYKLNKAYTDFGFLLLRSISSLTDEEAIEVARIAYPDYKTTDPELASLGLSIRRDFKSNLGAGSTTWGKCIQIYQYLQSIGIALPYLNYSVENLTKLGIIKIR